MKKLVKAVGLVLVLCTIGNADTDDYVPWDQGGPSTPVDPFGPEFEIVSFDKSSGQLTLKLSITYFPDAQFPPTCDLLLMTLYPFDGLSCNSPESLMVPYKTQNPFSTKLELSIPPNDTSYLTFRQECDRSADHYGITFVTTGDTLTARWGTAGRDVNLVIDWTMRHNPLPQEDYERAKREWEEKQKHLQDWVGKGTYRSGILLSPEDSVIYNTLSDNGKRNFRRMRRLERTPLADQDRQLHTIDGQWYERLRGETKFRPIQGMTKEELRADVQRRRDSLAATSPDNQVEVILDLRNPSDYEIARSLTDSLASTSDKGFYRTIVNRRTITELKTKGILYRRSNPPHTRPSDSNGPNQPGGSELEKKSESSLPGRESREVLLFDDFEGGWPTACCGI